jgi:hypothetical protein
MFCKATEIGHSHIHRLAVLDSDANVVNVITQVCLVGWLVR